MGIFQKIFNLLQLNLLGEQRHNRHRRWLQQNINKLYLSIGLVFLTTIVGILGFIVVEGYSLMDAFYMTVITLSTVGYGEVQPLSQMGRLFASLIIITNIGVFAYAISVLSTFIVEGELRKIWLYYSMQKKIDRLSGHIIICGYGRYGSEACRTFGRQSTPVVVIEQSPEVVYEARAIDKSILFVAGDATNDEILEEAGIYRAKALIASLSDDSENMYIVLTARQLNPNLRIISRTVNPKAGPKLQRAGADDVIMPERIGGFYMATLVGQPDLVEFFQIMSNQVGGDISLEEIRFDQMPNECKGKTIEELNIRKNTGASVIALKTPNGEYIVNPPANTIVELNTHLIMLGHIPQIQRFKDYWNRCVEGEASLSDYEGNC